MLALIALGSNLGDRLGHLESGLVALQSLGAVTASPQVMETPDESGRGPAYLNTVALLNCREADPRRLLEALLRIELEQGRDRAAGRNAPRTLDLDLIAFQGWRGEEEWEAPEDLGLVGPKLRLELPHPRALNRRFVMEPWRTLARQLSPADLEALGF